MWKQRWWTECTDNGLENVFLRGCMQVYKPNTEGQRHDQETQLITVGLCSDTRIQTDKMIQIFLFAVMLFNVSQPVASFVLLRFCVSDSCLPRANPKQKATSAMAYTLP